MQVIEQPPRRRVSAPSIIEAKNKLRIGHDECCNCCCCKVPAFQRYRYVQPAVPKSFKPEKRYYDPGIPLEKNTTYKLSFWPGPIRPRKPIIPSGNLTKPNGKLANQTTNRLSYMGNWNPEPEKLMIPCTRQWFGRGPMPKCTTAKCDFTWKKGPRRTPITHNGNLSVIPCPLEDNTTYRLSFWENKCVERPVNYKPVAKYEKSGCPLEDYTTYKLSFFDQEPASKEIPPWLVRPKYEKPVIPIEGCSTYKLSFWPNPCPEPRKPFSLKVTENILNADCCFEDHTTYGLSYWNNGSGDRPDPIIHKDNTELSKDPLAKDTVNKLSYLGNWAPEPEKPMIPCSRQLLGQGPMQDCTTNRHDFTWKRDRRSEPIIPSGNLQFSELPLESLTTNRLSYFPSDPAYLTPTKSFQPVRKYEKSDAPMEEETVMKLSFQPTEVPRVEKPKWAEQKGYERPVVDMEENTTYNLSFIPPGVLIHPDNENEVSVF